GAAPATTAGAGVVKLNSDGSLGYFDVFSLPSPGATNDPSATALAVDATGSVYVAGTSSCGFPTTAGSLHSTCTTGKLGFAAKINASGQNLVYATYLDGASGGSAPAGIAVDAAANAYITGSTTATDFPTTAGALSTTLTGGSSGFASKLNPSG